MTNPRIPPSFRRNVAAPPPPPLPPSPESPLPQLALLWLEVLSLGEAKRVRLGVDLVLSVADLLPVLLLKEKGSAPAPAPLIHTRTPGVCRQIPPLAFRDPPPRQQLPEHPYSLIQTIPRIFILPFQPMPTSNEQAAPRQVRERCPWPAARLSPPGAAMAPLRIVTFPLNFYLVVFLHTSLVLDHNLQMKTLLMKIIILDDAYRQASFIKPLLAEQQRHV